MPGGRLIVVHSLDRPDIVNEELRDAGFEIAYSRELTPKEIREKGSPSTKRYLRDGIVCYRVLAVKPNPRARKLPEE